MHILERMAANPHYKMTPKQLEALKRLRDSQGQVVHVPVVPKVYGKVVKHKTGPERVYGTDFDTLPEDNS